ncbi:MAG: hypothetical protein QMC36_08165 [Patescibacteria group bacterium]
MNARNDLPLPAPADRAEFESLLTSGDGYAAYEAYAAIKDRAHAVAAAVEAVVEAS